MVVVYILKRAGLQRWKKNFTAALSPPPCKASAIAAIVTGQTESTRSRKSIGQAVPQGQRSTHWDSMAGLAVLARVSSL